MEFWRRGQLIEKMQSAFDCFLDILDDDRLRGIVAYPAGSAQKNHGSRNSFRQDHSVVTGAAHPASGPASFLADCLLYLRSEKRIHHDGSLARQNILTNR